MKYRLQARYQARWGYGIVSALGCFLFTSLYLTVLTVIISVVSQTPPLAGVAELFLAGAVLGLGLAVATFIAALIMWSYRGERTAKRCALMGALTVLLSFVIIGFAAVFFFLISAVVQDEMSLIGSGIGLLLLTPLLVVFWFTMITLGMPYAIGALLSLLFVKNQGSAGTP